MGYILEAIIANSESVARFMESHDTDRFVSLPQGFAMIPLDERTCESIDQSLNVSYMSLLEAAPNECRDSTVRVLEELSDQSSAALLVIDCDGGPCDQRGVVYQDRQLIYDRYVDTSDEQRALTWKIKTGISLLWARLFSMPLGVHVPNPNHVPSVAHEVLELLGVQCDGEHFDAFDQLGLGKTRRTEDWLGHEG